MFCTKCGTENPADANFCYKCGKHAVRMHTASTEMPPSDRVAISPRTDLEAVPGAQASTLPLPESHSRAFSVSTQLGSHKWLAVSAICLAIAAAIPVGSNLLGPSRTRNELAIRNISFNANSFVKAAATGDIDVVHMFLKSDMSPNARSDQKVIASEKRLPAICPALTAAAILGHAEVVRILLDAGADPNAKDGNGRTALFPAVTTNYTEIVRLLLDKGADPNIRDSVLGLPALHYAASIDPNPEMLKLLLDRGANPNASLQPGDSSISVLTFAVGHGDTESVKILLDRGAQADVKDLANAAWLDHAEIVTLLWGQIARRNERMPDDVLFSGVLSRKAGMVKMLIDLGADPNVVGTGGIVEGDTPLIFAAGMGDAETVRLLLQRGANPALKGRDGRTALMRAREFKRDAVIKILLETNNPR